MVASILFLIAAGALAAGLEYRRWTWALTAPLRFGDIQNGYRWGYDATTEGYLNQYERMAGQQSHWGRWLDYGPLRLGVMTLWAGTTLDEWGDSGGNWQPAYEFSQQVLRFNIAMELLASVAAFLVVWTWCRQSASEPPTAGVWAWFRRVILRRGPPRTLEASSPLGALGEWAGSRPTDASTPIGASDASDPSNESGASSALRGNLDSLGASGASYAPAAIGPYHGLVRASLAGLFVWLNPAIALSAHGWPTWDMWIIPMYLLAVWLALGNRWFLAGLVIGVGAMFKGQQLGAAVVFILWPVLQGRPIAAVRWVIGVLLGIALVATPWMVSYLEPVSLGQYRKDQATRVARGVADWETQPLVSDFETAGRLGVVHVPRIVDRSAIVWVVLMTTAAVLGPIAVHRRKTRRRADSGSTPGGVKSSAGPRPPDVRVLPDELPRLSDEKSSTLPMGQWSIPLEPLADARVPIGPGAHEPAPNPAISKPDVFPANASDTAPSKTTAASVASGRAAQASEGLGRRVLAILSNRWLRWGLAVAVLPAIVLWPWWTGATSARLGIGLAITAVMAGAIWLLPRRAMPWVAALTLAASLLSCVVLFRGSVSWWQEGVMFGSRHWPWMIMGHTSNLPGILERRFGGFGWGQYGKDVNQTAYTIPSATIGSWPGEPVEISAKLFFGGIYALTLVACAVGVSMQHARRDLRFLIAITTPWILFFSLPTQIHERYLLYAAGVGMIMIGHSVGALLLAVFMTVVTWIMTIHVMLNNGNRQGLSQAAIDTFGEGWFSQQFGDKLWRFCQGTFPDIGWAVLLCAAVMLYLTLTPGRRRTRERN